MGNKEVRIELRERGIATDITPYVENLRLCHSVLKHGRRWSMTVKTHEWGKWLDYILGVKTLTLKITSFDSETNIPETTGWLTLYPDSAPQTEYFGTRLLTTIKGGDPLLRLTRKSSTRAFFEQTVDAILAQIVGTYGITPDTDSFVPPDTYYQLQMTDYEFIKEFLWPMMASQTSGRGDVWWWIDEVMGQIVLKAKAINYQAPSLRKYIIGKGDDRLEKAPVVYFGGEIDRKHGGQVTVTGYDWRTKQLVAFTANKATTSSVPTLGPFVPRQAALNALEIVSAEDTIPMVKAEALARWGRYGTRYFGMKIRSKGDLELPVGSMVEVEFEGGDPKNLVFVKGRYPVFEVEHEYVGSALRTNVVCYRRDAYKGLDVPVGADASATRGTDPYVASQGRKSQAPTSVSVSSMR